MVVLGSRSPQWREIRLELWVPGSSLAQPWLLWSKLTKERSLSIPSVCSCVFHTNKQIFKHNHLLSKSVILVQVLIMQRKNGDENDKWSHLIKDKSQIISINRLLPASFSFFIFKLFLNGCVYIFSLQCEYFSSDPLSHTYQIFLLTLHSSIQLHLISKPFQISFQQKLHYFFPKRLTS